MKNYVTYSLLMASIFALSLSAIQAQNVKFSIEKSTETSEIQKRQENYETLKSLGYQDKEIYEDLGNASFLSENYESTIFWYKKLFVLLDGNSINKGYNERYQFALENLKNKTNNLVTNTKDWNAQVKSEYYRKQTKDERFNDFFINPNASRKALEKFVNNETANVSGIAESNSDEFNINPIAIAPDGRTAYYSKGVYKKPTYGIFSKKEVVQKIYKAAYVAGEWKVMEELPLGHKNSSAMHPTISEDGKSLFFASNMPGSYGKFDIYKAEIRTDGSIGVAKNLGRKVNTDENDLYPNIVGGTSLFFASNGHKGYGGLDVFMVEVANNKVGWTVNLGSPINSDRDEISLDIVKENGVGYVVVTRDQKQGVLEKVAFSYSRPDNNLMEDKNRNGLFDAMNTEHKVNFATSIFEDN